ncbi:undecaprenyl-diphosphate phosphatase [soil metagenome]
MPDWLSVIFLGLLEGLTEFIPVSSTGHLLIAEQWLPKQSEVFNVVIQCGAALALIPLFWKKLCDLLFGLKDAKNRDFIMKLGVAFLITCIGGLALKKLGLKLDAEQVTPVAWATLIGGLVILSIERWSLRRNMSNEITWAIAIVFGVAQLIAATFPGSSRSGTTIMLAMMLGLARPAATQFSFLLGIPTLLAAGAYELLKAFKDAHHAPENWAHIALGFIAAAIAAFVVVKWLIRYVQSHTFNGFALYRIALGGLLLFWFSRG